MTNSVTLNGTTYNDGDTPPNNMGSGGHRDNFFPMLSDAVIDLGGKVTASAASQTAAAASQTAAAASAASAVAAPGTNATSTTSLSIGAGAKALTTQTGKSFVVGSHVQVARTSDATKWMNGTLTAYDSGTGSATVNVTNISGVAGPYTDWTISLSGAPGVTGTLNELMAADVASAATTSDVWGGTGNLMNLTGSAAMTGLPAAPNAGAKRTCIITGSPTLTDGANFIVKGVSGAITQLSAGDEIDIEAETTTKFRITVRKANGRATVSNGFDGTTHSGSFTLAYGDPYAQRVTPTGYGQGCTAAAATGFQKGAVCSIMNASDYDYAFNDSTGVVRMFIPPWTACDVSLADNSTAAGQWVIPGGSLIGITASFFSTTSGGASDAQKFQRIALDSDRELFLYGTTSCYARVWRKSTGVASSVALVRASLGTKAFTGCKSATDQVLVVTCSSTTAMEACTLSINSSTDAITVNGSPGTATLAGNWANFGMLVACTGGFVLSYGRATTVAGARGITISGTTPTISAEVSLSAAVAGSAQLYAVTGAVVLAIVGVTAGGIVHKPLTLSTGPTTLTGGTGATITSDTALFRSVAVGTRWHVLTNNVTLTGAIISVSGTTSTSSAVLLSAVSAGSPTNLADFIGVSSSKSCCVSSNSEALLRFNHLIDTAGVASAGTEMTVDTVQPSGGHITALSSSSNVSKFSYATTGSLSVGLVIIDSSGTSPALTDISETTGSSAGSMSGHPLPRNVNQTPHWKTLSSTAGIISIAGTGEAGSNGGNGNSSALFGSKITRLMPIVLPSLGTTQNVDGDNGQVATECWSFRSGPAGGRNQIVKIEAAQP